MTDMQRWGMEYERGEWDIAPDPEGAYVLLAEAKAAIAATRQDMLAKCIAAVEAANHEYRTYESNEQWKHQQTIAALRALREKQ